MFWATDLAPSYPILLLNKFKNLSDLLFFKETANYVAPGTPNWFLLKSKTYRIWLCGITYAKAFIPSLSIWFLERSKTLIWLLKLALLGSIAKESTSAKFFLKPLDDKDTLVKLTVLAKSLTNYGSYLSFNLFQ